MSEEEKEVNEYEGFEDNDIEMENEEQNFETVSAISYQQNFTSQSEGIGCYFFNEQENALQFSTKIVKEYEKPTEMRLFNGEQQILFLDSKDKRNINVFDFNKAKVVEQWSLPSHVDIQSIMNKFKNSQVQAEGTLLVCSQKGLFELDSRVKEKTVNSKVYTTNPKFTKLATTSDGRFLVGSEKGEVRLFDKLGKKAKTLLPGFGDKVIGADVT